MDKIIVNAEIKEVVVTPIAEPGEKPSFFARLGLENKIYGKAIQADGEKPIYVHVSSRQGTFVFDPAELKAEAELIVVAKAKEYKAWHERFSLFASKKNATLEEADKIIASFEDVYVREVLLKKRSEFASNHNFKEAMPIVPTIDEALVMVAERIAKFRAAARSKAVEGVNPHAVASKYVNDCYNEAQRQAELLKVKRQKEVNQGLTALSKLGVR